MRVFALVLLVIGGIASKSHAQSATAGMSAEEAQFASLINQFRQSLNLPTLAINPALQNAAKAHSDWMLTQDNPAMETSGLNHYGPNNLTPFQRMNQAGYLTYTWAGENIACGTGDPVKTFRQWAFSGGHLANMVNPHFHEMGVGRSGTGNEYCHYYWTNDFASVVDPTTDPVGTVDINLISQAIVNLTGPIPAGTVISLTEQPTVPATPTPGPSGNSGGSPSDLQQMFNQLLTGGTSISIQTAPISSLQCVVPALIGKGIISSYSNTDIFVDASRTSSNTYSVKLSYFLGRVPSSSISSVITSGVTITRNPDFPVVTLFSAPGTMVGGYMIQVDTQTNQAQFDSYGVSPGVTGTVLCATKF